MSYIKYTYKDYLNGIILLLHNKKFFFQISAAIKWWFSQNQSHCESQAALRNFASSLFLIFYLIFSLLMSYE